MKRFEAQYSENSITYWPYYESGKVGIIYLTLIGTLFVGAAIWMLLDNLSRETRIETQISLPTVLLLLCVAFYYIYRTMHVKIVVSDTGIKVFGKGVTIKKQIDWKDIQAVYFSQGLYGRASLRLFVNKPPSQSYDKNNKCDFAISINSVDEKKLLQLVPKRLWANKPMFI